MKKTIKKSKATKIKIVPTLPDFRKDEVQIRVNKRERKKLEINARKYQNGNLSEWLREAGKNYKPLKKSSGK